MMNFHLVKMDTTGLLVSEARDPRYFSFYITFCLVEYLLELLLLKRHRSNHRELNSNFIPWLMKRVRKLIRKKTQI